MEAGNSAMGPQQRGRRRTSWASRCCDTLGHIRRGVAEFCSNFELALFSDAVGGADDDDDSDDDGDDKQEEEEEGTFSPLAAGSVGYVVYHGWKEAMASRGGAGVRKNHCPPSGYPPLTGHL